MKVLFALSGFHKHERGAEVALMSVAEAMAAAGDDVTLMGSGTARPGTAYHFQHIGSRSRELFEKWPRFPPLRSETAWEDATFAANLLRKYDPKQFDAVITCAFPFTQWVLRRPTKTKPLQIFVTQNGDWPALSNESEFRTFDCDGLVCTNPDFFENNRAKWKSVLIPNGVNLSRFKPGARDRSRFGLPNDKKIILMVSAFIETKRVLDGIRAASKLPDAFLVVAGDGPLRDEAQRLADALMPGRFLRVSLTAQEMPDLYQCADVFLHMSLLEAFGNVFLEAWASGLPIVAHDSERLRWILGDYGYLCDTQNEQLLVKAIALATSSPAPDMKSGIERFAWSNIAEEYRNFIGSL